RATASACRLPGDCDLSYADPHSVRHAFRQCAGGKGYLRRGSLHLDRRGIHLDRLLPPALSLHRLRLSRTRHLEMGSEKEITDYETIQLRRGTYCIYGSIAYLRTGHFRRLAGYSESRRPGTQDSPENRKER